MVLSEKMNFVFYGGVSAVTYFLTKNVAARSTDALLSYIMNSNADANIKDHHTVKSIQCMLKKYKDMQDTHPAYESMLSVQEALKDLEDSIRNIKLKIHIHNSGYLTRFRTYDARKDNILIQEKIDEVMLRLDLFTKLITME